MLLHLNKATRGLSGFPDAVHRFASGDVCCTAAVGKPERRRTTEPKVSLGTQTVSQSFGYRAWPVHKLPRSSNAEVECTGDYEWTIAIANALMALEYSIHKWGIQKDV